MLLQLSILIYSLVFVFSQHSWTSTTQINNVVWHGDKIFVGAVNGITSLSSRDLHPLHNISTGPVRDSPFCNFDGSSCLRKAKPVETDNYNKILEILDEKLIVCGSVKQGTCSTYSPTDLSLIASGDIPVAANNGDASTVALSIDNRLIVAASHSGDSPYRDPFPAVAIREAPDWFVVNSGSLEGEAAVFLRAEFRSSIPIRYVSAFQSQHFVYFTSGQSKNARSPPTTKLIRFCANDTRFVSYSEIELQCRTEDNTNYPIITSSVVFGDFLIAAFTDIASTKSAICAFSLQRLKLTFWYNIDRCRGGSDTIGLPHVGRDAKCTNKSRVPLDEDTCELGVGGTIEAVEVASKELDEVVFSLQSYTPPDILLAGTGNGEIVMMKMEKSQLIEFGRRVVGGKNDKVAKIWIIGQSILAQLPASLITVPLASCNHLSSCSSCLLAEDPLCSWCHSLGRCTTSSQCTTPAVSVCPLKDGPPVPSKMAIDQQKDIFLPVKNLPKPHGFSYECVFGSATSIGKWNDMGVVCESPKLHGIFENENRMVVFLRTSLSTHPIVQHNFTVFDCSKYESCASCSSAEWGCDWCSGTKTCARNGKCNGDSTKECVRIDLSHTAPLMLSNKESTTLRLPMKGGKLLDNNALFTCQLHLDGKTVSSKAKLERNTLTCEAVRVVLRGQIANTTVPLSVVQGRNVVDTTKVTVFDCSNLASDCSSCLALSPLWKCSWCDGSCSHNCSLEHREVMCEKPQILEFSPNSGPMEGGTTVTIVGKDLGSSIEDVKDRVWIAGFRCNVVKYRISRKIVCRLEKGTSSGPVRISVGRAAQRIAESKDFFSFVEVKMFNIYPLFGPVSGGTKITVYGQHLNAGSNVSIFIGDVPCLTSQSTSPSSLTCVTTAASQPMKVPVVRLHIDSATVTLQSLFEFRPDPVITDIRPRVVFRSGGRRIFVEGRYFDSVLSARMYLLSSTTPPFELISKTSSCRVLNSTRMSCMSPRIIESEKSSGLFGRFPIGFAMDNVTSVNNLGYRIQMKVVPDPQLAPFKGIRVHQGVQPLILDGEFLNESAEPEDYKIFIGKERCYVTLVDSKQLVCNGPSIQPEPTDEKGNQIEGNLPLVSVIVGNVRTELGLIEYANELTTVKLWTLVLAFLLALCIVSFMLLLLWKKRKNERERDYKKIQLQMEHLESNVRKECKQAFAELQTSISMHGTEECEGADFLSFREFLSRVLWNEGSSSLSPSIYASTLPITLAQFDSLISCKQFVFALVESAESDSSMSPSEKSMLASLLLAALMKNFHYCTEIVLDLLRAHIAKTVRSRTSELLFRRSESLVEKLVGKWLTICLHSHILQTQGLPFYRLFKAFKYQTERGPVDAVTGAARYTINEAKLLKETVDTSILDCFVMDLSGRGPFTVRANACDTISQLKMKFLDVIYKDTPYSQRPHLSQFEIAWQCPGQGNLTLLDLDGCSTQKGMKRVNTLSYYGIPHGSFLLMVPQSKTTEISSASMGDSGQCSWSSLDRSSPYYNSSHCYHLVNPSKCQTMEKKRKIDENIPTSIPEVYLTRMLTSKGTVQKYIDDFLESVMFLEESSYPPVIKYVFDLLDVEAARNGLSSVIAQQWKVNCYVLRVWANLINNPRLLFDVGPCTSTEGNLTVVAQTLTDCFSTSEPIFGAHAPSSRLLFAKDVARLRPLAFDLFRRISRQPIVTDRSLADSITHISKELNTSGSTAALSELLTWVRGNGLNLVEVLSSNNECVAQRLPQRLSQVINLSLEPDHIYCSISDYSQ